MRTDRQMVAEFRKRGDVAVAAKLAVDDAYNAGLRDESPARYHELLLAFHESVTRALPSSAPEFISRLSLGLEAEVNLAVAFLEADPWFFRSGYEKQNLIRHLKRVTLSDRNQQRLRAVVLAAIDGRDRLEFRHYCRLAVAVWSKDLQQAIASRIAAPPDAAVHRRACWVIDAAIQADAIALVDPK